MGVKLSVPLFSGSVGLQVPLAQIVVYEQASLALLDLDRVASMIQEHIRGIAGLDFPLSRFLRLGLCRSTLHKIVGSVRPQGQMVELVICWFVQRSINGAVHIISYKRLLGERC